MPNVKQSLKHFKKEKKELLFIKENNFEIRTVFVNFIKKCYILLFKSLKELTTTSEKINKYLKFISK